MSQGVYRSTFSIRSTVTAAIHSSIRDSWRESLPTSFPVLLRLLLLPWVVNVPLLQEFMPKNLGDVSKEWS